MAVVRWHCLRLRKYRDRDRDRCCSFETDPTDNRSDIERIDNEEESRHLRTQVEDSFRLLPEKHRTVIESRYRGEKLHSIGSVLGVSKERVRQIETLGINRIRELVGPDAA